MPPRKTRRAAQATAGEGVAGTPCSIGWICRAVGIPVPDPEHRFDTGRRWRLDWAWVPQKIAVEVQGGLFTHGRHTRGAALLKEYEKINEAQIAGWLVFLVSPQQWNSGEAFALVKRAMEM